jgi:radical SAM protein with 4Fe4S-binding SPASM domain
LCNDFSQYHLDDEGLNRMFLDLLWAKKNLGLNIDSLEHYPACAFFSAENRGAFGPRNCSAGKTGCTIGHDGGIRPCSHAHMSYGNIADGLGNAWRAMSEWRDGSVVPDRCKKECKEFPMRCSGGCRIEAYNSTGKINSPDPFCKGAECPVVPMPRSESLNDATFEADDLVVPCRNLRLRDESFGHIAYRSSKYWMAVDATMGKLLARAGSNNGFTARDLAAAYNVPESRALHTVRLLAAKKLVGRGTEIHKERR